MRALVIKFLHWLEKSLTKDAIPFGKKKVLYSLDAFLHEKHSDDYGFPTPCLSFSSEYVQREFLSRSGKVMMEEVKKYLKKKKLSYVSIHFYKKTQESVEVFKQNTPKKSIGEAQ